MLISEIIKITQAGVTGDLKYQLRVKTIIPRIMKFPFI